MDNGNRNGFFKEFFKRVGWEEWRQRELNPRPSGCKPDALPLSYVPASIVEDAGDGG